MAESTRGGPGSSLSVALIPNFHRSQASSVFDFLKERGLSTTSEELLRIAENHRATTSHPTPFNFLHDPNLRVLIVLAHHDGISR